ncbi:glycerophosphodiester phosphodiesterase [Paraliomyxa miuraensis]|uniref:glycerophosphodiester phosphodiesterase n=1 Tax=Paraliomyxa miuraensis TaxID=376150 RepID=UPI00225158EA|nr:glycerophosphodiester phosphodiesterase family protein [Paraliomyxa miuraensis]MCX4242631.1 glycerophosphodiester phosphodiesterase family protein [Paraliomyxa miuraensis]
MLPISMALLPAARADCVDGRPISVGHRGAGNTAAGNPYPENTIPSLVAAGEQGATMVEFDVQLSADGIPVLMHDALVDATTDGMGCVSELTLDELRLLDAGVGSPMEGMGVQIPTLEEVLEAIELDVNVELKAGGDGCPEPTHAQFATAVLDVLAADPTPRLQTISSFELGLLEEVRAQDGGIYIGFLVVTAFSSMAAADAGFDALNLTDGGVDEAAVTTVREAGLELNVWTVNDPTRMAELFALDVDSIITNEIAMLEMVRAEQCPGEGDTGSTGEAGSTSEVGDETAAPGGTGDEGSASGSTSSEESSGTTGAPLEGQEEEGCACRAGSSSRWRTSPWFLGLLAVGWRRRRGS